MFDVDMKQIAEVCNHYFYYSTAEIIKDLVALCQFRERQLNIKEELLFGIKDIIEKLLDEKLLTKNTLNKQVSIEWLDNFYLKGGYLKETSWKDFVKLRAKL